MARVRYSIKNSQTTIALTFLTHIISVIGGVCVVFVGTSISFLYLLLSHSNLNDQNLFHSTIDAPPKQQDKHCIMHYDCDYDYDRKMRYKFVLRLPVLMKCTDLKLQNNLQSIFFISYEKMIIPVIQCQCQDWLDKWRFREFGQFCQIITTF